MLYNQKWADSKLAAPSLTYPSMAGLVHLLRNEELWPKGFKYRFDGAAIELANQFWPGSVGKREKYGDLTQMLAMGLKDQYSEHHTYWKIFNTRNADGRNPTAPETADRIEAFMNRATNVAAFDAIMALRLGC